jgi:5'-3' exonuclease
MGIKHFFTWLKTQFSDHITSFAKSEVPKDIVIDTFMIDLNGIFHNSAQKIYEYGNHARPRSMLRKNIQPVKESLKKQIECFEDVCATIEELVRITNPTKKLVLCIDGVAPQSKQNQQRQRRYRGAVEDPKNFFNTTGFDPTCISPGTKFMDHMSRYIDWYIRKRISEDPFWKGIDVIFSNEKVPGEGEHKLINYIRKYGDKDETFCINALDADLVMLSLSTHKENFYLLREDMYTTGIDYMYINIGKGIRKELVENVLFWEGCNDKKLINDFILVCFMCGNDFLPNIPSIAIMEKGLDTIIDMYKQTCATEGHLTDDNNCFRKDAFRKFLSFIACSEKGLLEEKIIHKSDYIEDPLLEKHVILEEDGVVNLRFEEYKDAFYRQKGMTNIEQICHSYLDGCCWVLTYYTVGVSDWSWIYPNNYSPFCFDLEKYISTYEFKPQKITEPLLPFQQLLCILPPKSAHLIPAPLNNLLTSKSSPISKFYPDTFHINYEGKKKKWEGVVELPVIDTELVKKSYIPLVKQINEVDMKRNISGKSFVYRYSEEFCSEFKSYYGNIVSCKVNNEIVQL